MGTIFAPTLATLSMGYFELTFYRICINELGKTPGQFILENWCRFLDDCETPLHKTKIDPNRLLEILNSINPSIKFTMETSDKELPFLDILSVSHSRPAIRTIVKKYAIYSSTENLYYSGKSTTEIKKFVRVKGKPKKT